MQVLEHKDRRLLLGESLEEAEDQLVKSTLLLGRPAALEGQIG